MIVLKPKYIAINSAIFAAISPLSTISFANNTDLPVINLDPITVTSTRAPSKVSDVIAQTTVIDEQDLQRYQGQTVLDVLRKQPGIGFYESGGMGKKSSFYLRGYDSSQVLVLIDGVRFGSLDSGQPPINLLPAEHIKRIEILHGASGTSIYGADAMGGVIQIFTKSSNDYNQFSITAGAGSNNQFLYGASAVVSDDEGNKLALSATHNETDGFNAIKQPVNNPYSNYYNDKDGFESDNYSLTASKQLNDKVKVGVNGLYSRSTVEYDSGSSFTNTYADNNNGSINAYVEVAHENATTTLNYGTSISEVEAFDSKSPKGSQFDNKQKHLRLESVITKIPGNLVFGAEYLKQSLDTSKANYDTEDRKTKSAFVGYNYGNESYDIQTNMRIDDYSDYDTQHTFNIGLAKNLSESLRFGASYNTAFRQPSFNDLYYPSSGNPDLEPEESENYEFFAQLNGDNHSTRITRYYSDIKNLIDYDPNNGWAKGNINKARISGTNVSSDWFVNNNIFGFSYDYQDAINKSGVYDGEQIKFRPKHKGKAYAGYQANDFDIRAEVEYVGTRYANDTYGYDLGTRMDNYTLLNFVGNYQLTPNLSSTLRINNLTNEKYTTIDTYGEQYSMDGTNVFGSLTYTWF